MALIKLHTPLHLQDNKTISEFEANDIRHIVSIVGDDDQVGTVFYLAGVPEKQMCLEPAKRVKELVAANRDSRSPAGPSVQIGSIGHFTGNLASQVTAHNVEIGNISFSTVNEQLKAVGIPQQERNELENIMDALKTAKAEDKPTLFQKGVAWIDRNKVALGTLAATLLSWFGHHAK
jgi:hypothetical protein